jgi:hypothetical protein
MLEKGKVYKVKCDEGTDDLSLQATVVKEGWLWLCTGTRDKNNSHPLLTSVATGARCWFVEDELEVADDA